MNIIKDLSSSTLRNETEKAFNSMMENPELLESKKKFNYEKNNLELLLAVNLELERILLNAYDTDEEFRKDALENYEKLSEKFYDENIKCHIDFKNYIDLESIENVLKRIIKNRITGEGQLKSESEPTLSQKLLMGNLKKENTPEVASEKIILEKTENILLSLILMATLMLGVEFQLSIWGMIGIAGAASFLTIFILNTIRRIKKKKQIIIKENIKAENQPITDSNDAGEIVKPKTTSKKIKNRRIRERLKK